ncbi:MAG: BrnT family toxin [Candidatus Omnitrophica bacterium]|nr:BrnT family toxin [Candidatus Omnitrophota bacterium]MCF7878913.1 BrnT family toxin [Candidatus Omnitrophota bacterium]MCF7888321.1 BrnT family toxin [Candidatus Omnitrophota bacterium]
MDSYKKLQRCTGFQWDQHNAEKNWQKHKVTPAECEEVFFNKPLVVADDLKHSSSEKRFYVLGKTDLSRKLFIIFTIRKELIRIISARNMNKNEKRSYDQYEKK